MSRMMLCLAGIVLALGCDDVSDDLPPSTQPKDLTAPWVMTTGDEFSMSSRSNDAEGDRVFSLKSSDFGGLLHDMVDEYQKPLAINPKEMMDWTLTGAFKGKNREEVLADIAKQCQLTLGKTSTGAALLTLPGRETQEFVIPVEAPSDPGTEEDE